MAKGDQVLIGLTGGIGSGKSTVARILRIMGIPVFDADSEVKNLYSSNEQLRQEIQSTFGAEIFEENRLNANLLAERIFTTAGGPEKMRDLIAPYLAIHFATWCKKHFNAPIVVKEAAILVESGNHKDCHTLIQVVAQEELRIQRVVKRSGLNEVEIRQRISKQLSDKDRTPYCDYTLVNNDQAALVPQVLRTLQAIRASY